MTAPRTIVVTGGIGSGKTTVCRHFESLGYPVYYSDDRAKALYNEHPGLLDGLERIAGVPLRRADGSFDASALAVVIFSDEGKRMQVEGLVHPCVYDDFVKWRNAVGCSVAFMESAIFLQKPLFHPLADAVIELLAPREAIVRRTMARDNAGRDSVERRMQAQECREGAKADIVIANDADVGTLTKRADEALRTIISSWANSIDY